MSDKFVNIKYLAVGLSIGKDHHVLCETGTGKGDDTAFAASVKQVIAAPQANVPGTKYSLTMKDNTNLNFFTDQKLRIFIAITEKNYPERVAQALLKEISEKFVAKYTDKSLVPPDGSIKGAGKFLKGLAQRFDNPNDVDKLSKLKGEVDATTAIMADSVQGMLQNTEKAEKLTDDAANLRDQANVFGNEATALRRKMQWRNIKMAIIVGLVSAMEFKIQTDTGKEDQAIELLNQGEASTYIHIFHRSCTVLGYAVYIAIVACSILAVVNVTEVATLFYDNGLPKMDNFKEYLLYFGGTFISLGFAWINQSYASRVHSFGRKNTGIGRRFLKAFFVYSVVVLTLIVVFVCLLDFADLDPIAMEILLSLLAVVAFFILITLWVAIIAFLPVDDQKVAEEFVKVEQKKFVFTRIISFSIGFLLIVTPFFYMYICVNLYRVTSEFWKIFICLVFHFFFTEIYLTYVRRWCEFSEEHPFFVHTMEFCVETILNIFRRFLFNDANNANLVVYFTMICGIQEIISRNYMEDKERWLCKILGEEFAKDKMTLIRRRKYIGYSVTARSIQEIASILVAPMMLVMFQNNRYGVDLGYDGDAAVDIQTLMIGTLLQLIVELLVIYVCSALEIHNKIPMSDFFFQFRTPKIFLSHLFHFLMSCFWVLHSFRTSPNSMLCHDPANICTCPSFKVYKVRCQEISLNSTAPAIVVQPSSFSAFFTDAPSIILAVIGILAILGISIFFYFRNKTREQDQSLKKQNERIKTLLDVTTTNLMGKSALQQAITTIESMCRGVSPSQAKLLRSIIEILKDQSKVNNIVDVNGMLTESSENDDVQSWLREQLVNHEEKLAINRGVRISTKSKGKSARVMEPMNLKKMRKSFTLNQTKMKLLIESVDNNNNLNEVQKMGSSKEGRETVSIGPEMTIDRIIDDSMDDSTSLEFLSWDFNVFSIKNKNPQSWLAWNSLARTNLIQELKLPKLQLSNFLLYVEQHYSLSNYDYYSAYSESYQMMSSLEAKMDEYCEVIINNPYHNNLHGADVCQAVLFLATTYEDVGGGFSSFDLFSLLFAAYIHDFNHPGLNSTYVIADWPSSGISSTFGTESPLEKHHLAMAFNLMRNVEEHNFLSSFRSSDLNYFRRLVTECVLATDLVKSMPWLSTARITIKDRMNQVENPLASVAVNGGSNNNDENSKKELEYKILLMQLSIKCADVSHPARLLEHHLEWSNRIRDEFYGQGDKERSKGMSISPLCDRNVSAIHYPQGQIGFINFVSKPIFMLMNEVCYSVSAEEKPWLKYMEINIRYWEEKKKELNSQAALV